MKLLAVDTSTTSCSAALLEDNHLLAEMVYTSGKTHSRHLMSMIHRILRQCHFGPSDIDGIAVTRGPGTFTGLRIGLSVVKGLCAAMEIPVVSVSSLAALAFPMRFLERNVVAMIDARRGEVYHARYQTEQDFMGSANVPMRVSPPERVAETLPDDVILVGSGAVLYRNLFEARILNDRFPDPVQHVIRASSVGFLAMDQVTKGDFDAIENLIPEYIRPSDAQIHASGSSCC